MEISNYSRIHPDEFPEEGVPRDLDLEIEALLSNRNRAGRQADQGVIQEARALRFCMEELNKRIQRSGRFQWTWIIKRRVAAKMMKHILTVYRNELGPEELETTPQEHEKIKATHPLLAADIELGEDTRRSKLTQEKVEGIRKILGNMHSRKQF